MRETPFLVVLLKPPNRTLYDGRKTVRTAWVRLSLTHTLSLSLSLSLFLPLSLTHSLSHSLSHTHTHSLSLSLPLFLSLSLTHTHSLSLSLSLTSASLCSTLLKHRSESVVPGRVAKIEVSTLKPQTQTPEPKL